MARYEREYRGRPRRGGWRGETGPFRGRRHEERRLEGREGAGYPLEAGMLRRARLPRKPAHGFPVRGIHTYDLDYGTVAGGPTTEYSGRAGYAVPEEFVGPAPGPRGPYTPWLEETRRGPGLYGEEYRPYPPRRRRPRR